MTIQESERRPIAKSGGPARDRFLDVVRTIATIRVVLWHAFGIPVLSYIVAAMPAMFFVFGALLAKSADRRAIGSVLTGRLRRTFIPLWFFATVVWTCGAVLASSFQWSNLDQAFFWFVPLNDPAPTSWEGGWVASPLWFMRTLFWLLISSPLWLGALRKFPKITLVSAVVAIFGLDAAERTQSLALESFPLLWWKVGDLALYGFFAAAGAAAFHWAEQLKAVATRSWLVGAAAMALFSASWLATHDVHLNVVNNSHPLHLFVGTAWLCLAFAARPQLSALAERPVVTRVVNTVNSRAMTIYLWHTTMIAGAVWVTSRLGFVNDWTEPVLRIALIAIGVFVAVKLFGWVEDLAAGNRKVSLPSIQDLTGASPKRKVTGASVAATVALLVGAASMSPATPQAGRVPPIPSKQPPAPQFVSEQEMAAIDMTELSEDEVRQRIQERLEQWRLEQGETRGAFVSSMSLNDLSFTAASGLRTQTDDPIEVTDTFDMASITKMFTTSVVLKLADQGYIDLDDTLPQLDAVPEFDYEKQLTPRMLLTHRSGLVNYRDTAAYQANPEAIITPVDAIRASITEPLVVAPGTETNYSSSNFLVLGLLVEQVTGRDFDSQLKEQILEPAGMGQTYSVPSSPGEPSGATAGTITTANDLLLGIRATLHDRRFASEEGHQTMLDVDRQSSIGAGVIGFCPCIRQNDGETTFSTYGHFGGDTIVVYSPSTGAVVAFHSTESIHDGRFDSVVNLVNDIGVLTARAVPDERIV